MNDSIPLNIVVMLEKECENQATESRQLILRKNRSETLLHIVLKILAYIYFWDHKEDLVVEPGYRFRRFKPDLISFRESEIPGISEPRAVDTWIECKNVKIDKLLKLSRYLPNCGIYWFNTVNFFQQFLDTFRKKKLKIKSNVHLIGVKIEPKFLEQLYSSLYSRKVSWKFIKSNNKLILYDMEKVDEAISVQFDNTVEEHE
ncbi:MAG: hypothetical protein ACFFD4_32550 [Candidatus Odinarchaeota archaeon]